MSQTRDCARISVVIIKVYIHPYEFKTILTPSIIDIKNKQKITFIAFYGGMERIRK